MIEIEKNGTGKPVVKLMDLIKIIVIVAGIISYYFIGRATDNAALNNVDKVIGIHEERIKQNKEANKEQDKKIDELFRTKQDKE